MDEICAHCRHSNVQLNIPFDTCLTCHASVCLSCRDIHTYHTNEHFFDITIINFGSLCKQHREVCKHFCNTCQVSICDKCRKSCQSKKHSTADLSNINQEIYKVIKKERKAIQNELELLETDSEIGHHVYLELDKELQELSYNLQHIQKRVTNLLFAKMKVFHELRFGIDPAIDIYLSKMHPLTIRKRIYNKLDNAISKLNIHKKDQSFPMMYLHYNTIREKVVMPQREKTSFEPITVWYSTPTDEELQKTLLRYGFGRSVEQYKKHGKVSSDDDKTKLLKEKEEAIAVLQSKLKEKENEMRVAQDTLKWIVGFIEPFLLNNKNAKIDSGLSKKLSGYSYFQGDVDDFLQQMGEIRKVMKSKDTMIERLKQNVEESRRKEDRKNPKKRVEQSNEAAEHINKLENEIKELEESMNIVTNQNSKLQHKLERTEMEKEALSSSHGKLSNQCAVLKQKLESAEKETEDLRLRLSQVSGAKLTSGNAAIANLGDRYRPTKIAEMFSELYDTEWTEAMDELTDAKPAWSEIVIVRHLFMVMQGCYKACRQLANEQMNDIYQRLTMDAESDQIEKWFEKHVAETKQIKDARKKLAFDMSEHIKKVIFKRHLFEAGCSNYGSVDAELVAEIQTKPFTERCITISWLMVVQDPEMYIDDDVHHGIPLDKEKYREYTKSGPKVAYGVWPALYLQKDGPLMIKGVVQGTK